MLNSFISSTCYCGNSSIGLASNSTLCSYLCLDGRIQCGGPNALSLYRIFTGTGFNFFHIWAI